MYRSANQILQKLSYSFYFSLVPFKNHTNNMLVIGNETENGFVNRLKCRTPLSLDEINSFTYPNGTINEKNRTEAIKKKFLEDSENEEKSIRLEQDRIFHTCHKLPKR